MHNNNFTMMFSKIFDYSDTDSETDTDTLIHASDNGNIDIVRALLATDVAIDAVTDTGDTALLCASCNGHIEVVRALLTARANMDIKNNYGATALLCASCEGYVDVVQALLVAGANVDIKNRFGNTALSAAKEGLVRDNISSGTSSDYTHIIKLLTIREHMAAFRIHRFWRDVCFNPVYAHSRVRLFKLL